MWIYHLVIKCHCMVTGFLSQVPLSYYIIIQTHSSWVAFVNCRRHPLIISNRWAVPVRNGFGHVDYQLDPLQFNWITEIHRKKCRYGTHNKKKKEAWLGTGKLSLLGHPAHPSDQRPPLASTTCVVAWFSGCTTFNLYTCTLCLCSSLMMVSLSLCVLVLNNGYAN